jgi:hypothetical protein
MRTEIYWVCSIHKVRVIDGKIWYLLCCVSTLGFRQYSRKPLPVLHCECQVSLSQFYCLPSLMMFTTERYRFMKMRCFSWFIRFYTNKLHTSVLKLLVISSERWRLEIPCMMLLSKKVCCSSIVVPDSNQLRLKYNIGSAILHTKMDWLIKQLFPEPQVIFL